jgi:hypothetical protein
VSAADAIGFGGPDDCSSLIARAVTDSLYRFVVPAVAAARSTYLAAT